MNIKITPSAREEILKVNTPGRYMKIELTKVGCCSMAFTMFEDVARSEDKVVQVDDIKLLIAPSAKEVINKITIDYKRNPIIKEFKIIPQ